MAQRSKTSEEYWREREERQRRNNITDEREYAKEINKIYQNMMDNIQKEIESFYAKYAAKEGITMAEAKKRVSQADIKAYERKAKRYVEAAARDRARYGKTKKDAEYFSDQANAEMRLYNLTMKVNRLEMLKANIGVELVNGFDELQQFLDGKLTDRTLAEFERQAGILGHSVRDNQKFAHAIVNASFHNATFSERIWANQDLLKAELSKLLQTGLIQGENPRVLARKLKKTFHASTYDAERLMRTELARVQTEAQKQSFIANGFEEYTFHANRGCCDACADLDGKHFKVKDMMPGKNAPPMHPNCRCSVSAYEDSDDYEAWLDFLSKGGTTEEWEQQKDGRKQTGGKWYKPYDEKDKKDVAASKAYRSISRRNDIATIAHHSGFSKKDIKQIKRHIFYNKHQTYDGYKTLYPDYDMAVAWNRIYNGNALERDILLLHHELLESALEKEYNLTLAEAHSMATEKYDWMAKLDEELGIEGEPYGLL